MTQYQEEFEEAGHPADYLKCEKLIDGAWVVTGWAPHEQAAERHAEAIGGTVRAICMTDNDLPEVGSYCFP